jgi:hypothetical protein
MRNRDDSASDEERLATPARDYRALLAMTHPLVITEHTPLSLRGEEIPRPDLSGLGTGSAISLEPGDCRAELTLRRGEILRPGKSGLRITGDEGLATTREEAGTSPAPEVENDAAAEFISALPQTGSNLEIRIYLGMS